MIKSRIWILGILLSMLFVTACNKDEDENVDPQVSESETLVKFLESTDSPYMKDYVNTDMPSIMPASEVKTLSATGDVYIIDIRSADDFAAGHIEGAHNVTVANLLGHVEGINTDDYAKVSIVCYTGQTAGYVTTLLRIMGYDNVYSMKWGMSSWHEDFAGKWNSNIGNTYTTQFTSDATAKNAEGDLPVLSTGHDNGMDILEARVDAVFAEGFGPAKVSSQAIFDNLDNYYIVNYWPAGQYENPGHIPGAVQYTPKESISFTADLKTLPTDKPIAVYCYTGQTSAFLAAYLRVLGYDAKSILFGTNGMIYDNMVSMDMTTWSDAQIMGYDYVQ